MPTAELYLNSSPSITFVSVGSARAHEAPFKSGSIGGKAFTELFGTTMSLLELHEGAFVELGVESGAPMRGQIRRGSDLPEQCIGLEDLALEMLGLDVGDTVWLRLIEAFKAA